MTVLKENETHRITEDRILGRFLEGKNKYGQWVIVGSFSTLGYSKYTNVNQVWNEVALQK